MVAERPINPRKWLPVRFGVRVDEVIEGVAFLFRIECEVTAAREFDAVLIVRPEEIVPPLRVFGRF